MIVIQIGVFSFFANSMYYISRTPETNNMRIHTCPMYFKPEVNIEQKGAAGELWLVRCCVLLCVCVCVCVSQGEGHVGCSIQYAGSCECGGVC